MRAATLLLSSLLLSSPALAATVVVPLAAELREGTSQNRVPFTAGGRPASIRYQQVYGAAAFDGLDGPQLVTEIAFRPQARVLPYSVTLPDVEVRLSTTAWPVDGLSETMDDNVGADDALVFAGELVLTTNVEGPFNGPKAFDLLIPLQQPFVFDPAGGNLLLEVWIPDTGPRAHLIDAEEFGLTGDDLTSRVRTEHIDDAVGHADSIALVTRFTLEPAVLEVAIDVKPHSPANVVNPLGHGWLTVALLGSEDFDVADVELASLAFGPAGAAPRPGGGPTLRDLDGDGIPDLRLRFRVPETGIEIGESEACLSGETSSGIPFEGCDAIRTMPACGLGPELLPLLGGLLAARRQR